MVEEKRAAAARTGDREPLDLGAAVAGVISPGVSAVAHYGDRQAEYRQLSQGCGLIDRLWVEHLELRGEDRRRFLNGLVTGDTRSLEAGDGRFVFLTSAQGRILAEARVAALSDSLLLELPAGCAAPIAEHLSKFIVADRVEIRQRPDLRSLSLVGPAAETVAERFSTGGEAISARWAGRLVARDLAWLMVAREERLGGPALTVRVGEDQAARVAAELLRPIRGIAARPVGFAALEALRIEAGQARFGADFDSRQFPQEVGESDALDFEKGCYLGQEVIARIHYRGKVNHRLCGLRLTGEALPAPGAPVTIESDEVGRCGSAARSFRLGRGLALTVLHHRAETGAEVAVDGQSALVTALPFAPD